MGQDLIISVSGMRGVVGENLTPAIAAEYGCAFGTFLRGDAGSEKERLSVCMGRDSRVSGPMLMSAMAAGLCAAGVNVIDLGLVPTPSVGVMVQELGCDGGVIITASHNPIPYNGIKLLLGNGMAPPPATAAALKRLYLEKRFELVDSPACGKIVPNAETDRIHIEKVLAIVDAQQIAGQRYKIVLDSVNGAGAGITKKLLSRLGCTVTAFNDEPTGLFAHEPEPTAANLTALCERVKSEGADLGFAQDPDADRLAIVDEQGTYIGEEYTLALAARHAFAGRSGTAAANLSTSRMIDDVAERAGGRVVRTPVGEANVAQAMLEHGCIIGGEGNGGVIDLRVGPVRDSLVGIALVLQLMAQTGKSIGQLRDEIGGYYMQKDKFSADADQAERIMELAKTRFAEAKLDTADGCRFDLEDGWIHLRTSNTEPVMRMIIEARDESVARRYIDSVMEIRTSVLEHNRGGR
ncbi:MAG: phosphoglucosamine mutase [Sedimentisphaerales bacterium]|nr:phosphoglucosamine mutase [Sedimentisphaerales bacterium]